MKILTDLREDWDYSDEVTEQTGLFSDMEFESIDAVALGSAIEDHFNQRIPFSEFLAGAYERKAEDISVGELLDFVHEQLNSSEEAA
jgi:acyl carrier protein